MWCVIWKKEDNIYQIFTNLIFDSEKNAVEFKNKQKFKGVNENEINK
jgi:hypothetical protein